MSDEKKANIEAANWYVVHTYSGHEDKVKTNIEKMVENRGMMDEILDVVVPTEEYIDVVNGENKVKERKLFPGYVLIKMIVNDDSWYLVRNTRGVTGFVGSGNKPIPLTEDEVKALGVQRELDVQEKYKIGDLVRVKSGPFEDFEANIENVDSDRNKIKVLVSMFGRETSMELDYDEVELVNHNNN